MAGLKITLVAVALLWAAPAAADPLDRWSAHIGEASSRFGIPVAWIRRVMRAESAGRTTLGGRPIVSRAGAMGLMQLMPGTWAQLRRVLGLGSDPHDPRDNILAGTAYLRMMYDRFGYPGLFSAYNAGPARYARHLATGRRLPQETVAYVANVAGRDAPAPAAAAVSRAAAPRQTMFALRAGAPTAGDAAPSAPSPSPASLFVPLSTAVPR